MTLLLLFIVGLVLTIPAAHVVGWSMSKKREIKAGHIREAMPSLPSSPPQKGRAERRWDRAMNRVEKTLLDRFKDGATHVHAAQIAGQIAEPPELVEAVLARMREEIPCRMKIMRSGLIYHDFEAPHIKELVRQRRRSRPRQFMLAVLTAFANLGAAWPFISVVIIVLGTFAQMNALNSGPDPESAMIGAGITGIALSIGIMLTTLVAGFVARLLLHPVSSGPRLGELKVKEAKPQRRRTQYQNDPSLFFALDAASHSSYAFSSRSTTSFWDRRSSGSGSSGGGLDIDMDDAGEGAALIVVIVILVAILGAALTAIGVWLRGIWRAIKRLDEPPAATSPTLWVRTAETIDKWERYLPTNDLVIRALHSLKRQVDHRRPPDDDLAARILILAKAKGGVVTGLDIVFHEGLDLDEAHEIGARLSGMLDGQILLDNEGELAFAFPPRTLEKLVSKPDEDMWAEYITFDRQGVPKRRDTQDSHNVPVNLVGLTQGHMSASARLVAGTYLMALMAGWFVTSLDPGSGFMWLLSLVVMLGAGMMAFSAASLVAATRYMAKRSAAHGIRRDIRRAAFKHVHHAIARGEHVVNFVQLEAALLDLFKPAWNAISKEMIHKETQGVAVDLELEPSTDPELVTQHAYMISSLARRLAEDREFAQVFDFEGVSFDFSEEEDTVVFDTQVEHDQVTVLGQL